MDDLMDRFPSGWEQILRGIRKTGLSVDEALSVRRAKANDYTNPAGFMKYMEKRKSVESAIGRKFTEKQSDDLSWIMSYFRTRAPSLLFERTWVRNRIQNLVKSGLSPRQLREVVDRGLITDNPAHRRQLKEWIDLEECVKQTPNP